MTPPNLSHGNGSRGGASSGLPSSLSLSARAVLRAASNLVRRFDFAARAGFRSFKGARDLYSALGYLEAPTLADYRERYERGGIAARVVNWLPETTWGIGPVQVVENTKPESESSFEREVMEIFETLQAQSKFLNADILASRDQYSIILIGTSDSNLNQPITRLPNKSSSITYLMPIPQERARISEWVGQSGLEQDKSDPRYGKPKYYQVQIGTIMGSSTGGLVDTSGSSSGLKSIPVHYSRIIHDAPNALEDDIYSPPELQSVWNDFDDFYKIKGGGAEAQWIQQSLPTLFDIDKDYDFGDSEIEREEEEKRLVDEVEAIVNKLRPYGITQGVTAQPLAGKGRNIDFASNGEFLLKVIAGAKRIPFRELVGNQVGLRSSEQDAKNVQARVSENITRHVEPLLRDFIDRLIKWGVVSQPLSGKYKFMWPETEELDELQKGTLISTYAAANKSMVDAGLGPAILPNEMRGILKLDPLPEVVVVEDKAEDKPATSAPTSNIADNNLSVNSVQ